MKKQRLISEKTKRILLQLARGAIAAQFDGSTLSATVLPAECQKKAGVFVTLTMHGDLRGCIGTLDGDSTIYHSVIENAVGAAFNDPRFPPVLQKELEDIEIEISVLSAIKTRFFPGQEDMLNVLEVEQPGVCLQAGPARATFLPQVWDQFPSSEEFLSSLCAKAGLLPDFWRTNFSQVIIGTYTVQSFSEDIYE